MDPTVGHCAATRRAATCIQPKPICFPAKCQVWKMASITIFVATMHWNKDSGVTAHLTMRRIPRAYGSDSPSIHWREAWKYGERGFRYCQLDIGHALGALRYAAGMLGWTARIVDQIEYEELTALLGLDRIGDFLGAEQEEPDLLIAIDSDPATNLIGSLDRPCAAAARACEWTGRANLLDPHPMYRWPVIEQVSLATRGEPEKERLHRLVYPPVPEIFEAHAASIIQNRRSAQRFDSKQTMSAGTFFHMLDCLLDRPAAPWDIWAYIPRVHPIFFVHRVEGARSRSLSFTPGSGGFARPP